jgi:hypothetical protein
MSVVSLLGVKVLNNPAPFSAPYEFEITFECLEQLREGKTRDLDSPRINNADRGQIWSGSLPMLALLHRTVSTPSRMQIC